MFDNLGWLSVNQLVVYHTVIYIFKIRKSGEPESLATVLKNDNLVTGHILLPKPNLTLAEKSFTFRGARLWNSLPGSLRKTMRIGGFKKQLRKWITENIQRFLE